MSLHSHTCGIGAAVPGMLHWCRKEQGSWAERRSQMHGKVDRNKTCLNIDGFFIIINYL